MKTKKQQQQQNNNNKKKGIKNKDKIEWIKWVLAFSVRAEIIILNRIAYMYNLYFVIKTRR